MGLWSPDSLWWEEQYSKGVEGLILLPDCLGLNPLSELTSHCLVLPIYKMGITTVPTPQQSVHVKHLEQCLVTLFIGAWNHCEHLMKANVPLPRQCTQVTFQTIPADSDSPAPHTDNPQPRGKAFAGVIHREELTAPRENQDLLSIYLVPNTVLGTQHRFSHCFLTKPHGEGIWEETGSEASGIC